MSSISSGHVLTRPAQVRLLEPEYAAWQRALTLEAIRAFCADADLLYFFFEKFDQGMLRAANVALRCECVNLIRSVLCCLCYSPACHQDIRIHRSRAWSIRTSDLTGEYRQVLLFVCCLQAEACSGADYTVH